MKITIARGCVQLKPHAVERKLCIARGHIRISPDGTPSVLTAFPLVTVGPCATADNNGDLLGCGRHACQVPPPRAVQCAHVVDRFVDGSGTAPGRRPTGRVRPAWIPPRSPPPRVHQDEMPAVAGIETSKIGAAACP